jgi:hypothetical protein
MNHPIYRVAFFEILKPYTLLVRFDDGTEQEIDFQSVLGGEMYQENRLVWLLLHIGLHFPTAPTPLPP